VWSSNAIVGSLRDVNKSEINLLLQKNGIETGLAESGEASAEAQARMLEEESKQTWLISLSLLVCVVGIANAMLMSVTERFREIGTMKCLGALDSFIVKLFLLESTFQGFAGTTAGIIIGFALTFLLALLDYGGYVLDYFPLNNIAESAGYALVVGTSLSLIGAMLPAYRAAKMEPVEAMRSDT
jgi:putative ABC transport system permease protein